MDSGLGQALIGGGLQGDLRQPIFSIGLKGVDPANAAKARTSLCLLGLLCDAYALHTAARSCRWQPSCRADLACEVWCGL